MKKIIKEITPIKKKVENVHAKKRVAAYARVSTEQDERFILYRFKEIIMKIILNLILIGNLLIFIMMKE